MVKEENTIFDLFHLNGKVALVTGAAGLLGKRFCKVLASAGAKISAMDWNREVLNQLDLDLKRINEPSNTLTFGGDVTNREDIVEIVEQTLNTFGRIDILVCCAAQDPKFDAQHAQEHLHNFEDYPLDVWEKAIDVNLTGTFLSAQAVTKAMLAQGSGVMIFLSSIYGLVAPDQRLYKDEKETQKYKPPYYSVTKSGILGLVRYLAAYYGEKNIRVNALSPGGVYNQHDESFVKSYASRTMLGRMANINDLDGALLFLASDASQYMTGANLVVDGGWTAW